MSPAEIATAVRWRLASDIDLGFRDFARHAYDAEPEPARMLENCDRIARLQAALSASMTALVARLRAAT